LHVNLEQKPELWNTTQNHAGHHQKKKRCTKTSLRLRHTELIGGIFSILTSLWLDLPTALGQATHEEPQSRDMGELTKQNEEEANKSLEQFMSFLLVRGREIILCKAQGLGFRVHY